MTRSAKATEIGGLIDRFQQLPRFQAPSSQPLLAQLRQIQVASVRTASQYDSRRAEFSSLVEYYIDQLHSGVDLTRVVAEKKSVLNIVTRLEESYTLVLHALEFSVLAQELDDALIGSLPAGCPPAQLENHLRESRQQQARLKHADLLRPLGPGLAPYTRSRIAQVAFKVAMTPLRATGLAPLVVALDKGYDVLRRLKDVEGDFERLIQNNRASIASLY